MYAQGVANIGMNNRKHTNHRGTAPLANKSSPSRRTTGAAPTTTASHATSTQPPPPPTSDSYTIALRALWTSLARLMREVELNEEQHARLNGNHHMNNNNGSFHHGVSSGSTNGGNGNNHFINNAAAVASRTAIESGLDSEMVRLLSAIRSDTSTVVTTQHHELELLLPLLLALAIAPFPTEVTQSLATEVLAKVLVAAQQHHLYLLSGAAAANNNNKSRAIVPNKGSSATMMVGQTTSVVDVFLVHHRVMDALELALGSATSQATRTSILELIFVASTLSSTASAAIVSSQRLVQQLLDLLQLGIPAQICYVAAILQSVVSTAQHSHHHDAAAILCSYNTHHAVLNALHDFSADDLSVTAIGMLLRLLIVLVQECPRAFLPMIASPSRHNNGPSHQHATGVRALVPQLISSPWADVADLGCLLLSAFLQPRRRSSSSSTPTAAQVTPAGGATAAAAAAASEFPLVTLHEFAESLVQTPIHTAGKLFGSPPHKRRVGGTANTSDNSMMNPSSTNLVTVLSSLMCAPHQHLAVSASYALMLLTCFATRSVSEALAAAPIGLHNLTATLLEFGGAEGYNGVGDGSSGGNDGSGGERREGGATSSAADQKKLSQQNQLTADERRVLMERRCSRSASSLSAMIFTCVMSGGASRSKTALAKHLNRHLSSATKALLAQFVEELLAPACLDDGLVMLLVLCESRPVLDAVRHYWTAKSLDVETKSRAWALTRDDDIDNANHHTDNDDDEDDASSLRYCSSSRIRRALMAICRHILFPDETTRHNPAKTTIETALTNHNNSNNAYPYHRRGHQPDADALSDQSVLGSNYRLVHSSPSRSRVGAAAASSSMLLDADLVPDEPTTQQRPSAHNAAFIHNSIRVVVRLANNYRQQPKEDSETEMAAPPSTRPAITSSSTARRRSSSASPAATEKNLWAAPTKHPVERRWSVEHLQRSDVYLFDCPLEYLTPGLQDVIDGLGLHMVHLRHSLNLCTISKPQRRCVLLDLYTHVYPTMLTCLQFIQQSIGVMPGAARVVADSPQHNISSANVVDLYHAIGLSCSSPTNTKYQQTSMMATQQQRQKRDGRGADGVYRLN